MQDIQDIIVISVYVKITPHHVRITPHVVCVRKEYVTLQDSVFNVNALMDSTVFCVLIVRLSRFECYIIS